MPLTCLFTLGTSTTDGARVEGRFRLTHKATTQAVAGPLRSSLMHTVKVQSSYNVP